MTDVVQVERVANGYLVRVPAQRTGGGVIAGERVYIAAAPLDVASILEEEIWPPLTESSVLDAPEEPPEAHHNRINAYRLTAAGVAAMEELQ